MTVFFKTLSFGNRLSYQALLGLEWKIFCHSLWICFHCFIRYESLAAIIMVRCPYIYFQDSISLLLEVYSDICLSLADLKIMGVGSSGTDQTSSNL